MLSDHRKSIDSRQSLSQNHINSYNTGQSNQFALTGHSRKNVQTQISQKKLTEDYIQSSNYSSYDDEFSIKYSMYNPQTALNFAGNSGTYQKILVHLGVLVAFSATIVLNWNNFIFGRPLFYCYDTERQIEVLCSEDQACSYGAIKWDFHTLVYKYDQVCGDNSNFVDNLRFLKNSIGYLLAIFAMVLSDILGRKTLILFSFLVMNISLILHFFVNIFGGRKTWHLYFDVINYGIIFGMFLGSLLAYLQLIFESIGFDRGLRSRGIVWMFVGGGVKFICMTALGKVWNTQDFVTMYVQLFTLLSGALCYIYQKESPLFLFRKGHATQFIKVLYEYSLINYNQKNPDIQRFQNMIDLSEINIELNDIEQIRPETKKFKNPVLQLFHELFCSRKNMLNIVLLIIQWTIQSMAESVVKNQLDSLYSLNFLTKHKFHHHSGSIDVAFNETIMAISNTLAGLAMLPFISYIRRKRSVMILNGLIAVMIILIWIVTKFVKFSHIEMIPQTTVCGFLFGLVFQILNIVYMIYSLEIFETSVRSSAVGLSYLLSKSIDNLGRICFGSLTYDVTEYSIGLFLLPIGVVLGVTLFMKETLKRDIK